MYYDQYGRHVDPYGSHGLGYDDRGHSEARLATVLGWAHRVTNLMRYWYR